VRGRPRAPIRGSSSRTASEKAAVQVHDAFRLTQKIQKSCHVRTVGVHPRKSGRPIPACVDSPRGVGKDHRGSRREWCGDEGRGSPPCCDAFSRTRGRWRGRYSSCAEKGICFRFFRTDVAHSCTKDVRAVSSCEPSGDSFGLQGPFRPRRSTCFRRARRSDSLNCV
jgi:hypothetical protein